MRVYAHETQSDIEVIKKIPQCFSLVEFFHEVIHIVGFFPSSHDLILRGFSYTRSNSSSNNNGWNCIKHIFGEGKRRFQQMWELVQRNKNNIA